ncbi:MAG TPA: hypothetical protein VGN90_09345 [Pyrinomonadaceae bacterium]|nr:hypothetical protein [Pyrinomonadaceae bacterium]
MLTRKARQTYIANDFPIDELVELVQAAEIRCSEERPTLIPR